MPEYESPSSSLKPGSTVVAYLRDSGHENQELSVAQQEAAIRDWCVKHQLMVEHIYKDEARRVYSDADREANGLFRGFTNLNGWLGVMGVSAGVGGWFSWQAVR